MIGRFLTLFSVAGLAACGAPKSDYSGAYVGGDQTALMQLHIVEGDGGQITGNLAISQLDYAEGKVKLTTRPFSGVRNGDQFSLLAKASQWGAPDSPLSLEANGGSLVFLLPGTGQTLEMQRMGQAEYRGRLTEFAQALNGTDVGMLPDD